MIGGGPEGGIFKTTNAGKKWTKLTKGLPTGDMGRVGLAVDGRRIRRRVTRWSTPKRAESGFFRSDDGGGVVDADRPACRRLDAGRRWRGRGRTGRAGAAAAGALRAARRHDSTPAPRRLDRPAGRRRRSAGAMTGDERKNEEADRTRPAGGRGNGRTTTAIAAAARSTTTRSSSIRIGPTGSGRSTPTSSAAPTAARPGRPTGSRAPASTSIITRSSSIRPIAITSCSATTAASTSPTTKADVAILREPADHPVLPRVDRQRRAVLQRLRRHTGQLLVLRPVAQREPPRRPDERLVHRQRRRRLPVAQRSRGSQHRLRVVAERRHRPSRSPHRAEPVDSSAGHAGRRRRRRRRDAGRRRHRKARRCSRCAARCATGARARRRRRRKVRRRGRQGGRRRHGGTPIASTGMRPTSSARTRHARLYWASNYVYRTRRSRRYLDAHQSGSLAES